MKPASQNDAPDNTERNSASSRPKSVTRRSAESNHQPIDTIDVIAVEEEKKEKFAEAELRGIETSDAERSKANTTEEEEIEYPSGLRLFLLTVGLCLVIFVVSAALDCLALCYTRLNHYPRTQISLDNTIIGSSIYAPSLFQLALTSIIVKQLQYQQ